MRKLEATGILDAEALDELARLALVGRDIEAGSLLLFVRDGIVVAQRHVEDRAVEGGLCLGHRWPRAEELGVDIPA